MLRRALGVGWLSLWFASAVASAASLTWSISGGTFADGGTFSGTFVQDLARDRPTTWNLSVAGGGSNFSARSYTPANSSVGLLDWPPNVELTYHFVDPDLGSRQLRLTPASPLDGSVSTVPLSLLASQGGVECFNCTPFRNIVAGSLVLTSATPRLTLASIAPDPTVVGATTTATISMDSIAALGPPTGSVIVYDSFNTPICAIFVPAATSCTFTPTTPGGHSLHALYLGDANYETASSDALAFTVVPAAVATVTFDSVLPSPTAVGATTTATVHVAPVAGYPAPTGLITVFFYGSGDTTLCTITLPATVCTFAPKFGGSQTVGAQYSGDAIYASGYSNTLVMTVAPVPSVVNLGPVTPSPTAVGTATTATVSVGAVAPFGPPTGTIRLFEIGGAALCTITLPATSCVFTPATAGNETLIARYDGDANYDSGLSSPRLLLVRAPSTIDKAFTPASIPVSGMTTLTFTLTNPNTDTALTAVAFSDTFPSGLVVAATPNASAVGCGAPTFAPAAGNASVAFSGGTIAASATCTVTVDVAATTRGLKNNVTSAVTSTEGGTGGSASASLAVIGPPAIAKAFSPPGMPVNGTTTLTFRITNPNPGTPLTGIGFTDALLGGLEVAAPPNATLSGCGTPTFAPAAGNTMLSFSAGTIPGGGICSASVDVTSTLGGLKGNITGSVTSTEGGTGGTAAAFLVVVTSGTVAPPTIAKEFGTAILVVGRTTTLTFTLTNPNPSPGPPLTGVGFADTLPAGLTVTDGSTATCGGMRTTSGGNTITLVGAMIAPGATCSFSLPVTATTPGAKNNLTGTVTSNEEGFAGGTASASLTVVEPEPIPTLSTFALAVLALALLLCGLRRRRA